MVEVSDDQMIGRQELRQTVEQRQRIRPAGDADDEARRLKIKPGQTRGLPQRGGDLFEKAHSYFLSLPAAKRA